MVNPVRDANEGKGCRVDIPSRRVAAPPRVPRGYSVEASCDVAGCGRSVSISSKGDVVAIGCPFYDERTTDDPETDPGYDLGRVRIYKLGDDNVWRRRGDNIVGVGPYDRAGHKIDLSESGDAIAVSGEKCLDAQGKYRAHMRVFQWTRDDGWVQHGDAIGCETFGDPDLRWRDDTGFFHTYDVAISASGDRVAYSNKRGAEYVRTEIPEGAPPVPGITRIYERQAERWRQMGDEIVGAEAPDVCYYCATFVSVDLNGDGTIVAIGNHNYGYTALRDGSQRTGRARAFKSRGPRGDPKLSSRRDRSHH